MPIQTFESELAKLINYFSLESKSDTPDFILASYLKGCLEVYNQTVRKRDTFYGTNTWPDRTLQS